MLRVGGWNFVFTIASQLQQNEVGHALVDLKLEVKCEPVLIHYQTSKN